MDPEDWTGTTDPDTGAPLVGWRDPATGETSTNVNSGFGPGSIPLWGSVPESATESAIAQMEAATRLAREQAEWNLDLFRGDLPHEMTESAIQDADSMNDYMRGEIRQDIAALMGEDWLDNLMSGLSGSFADVVDVVGQMLPSMTEFVGARLRGEVSPEQSRQFDTRMGEDVMRLYGRTDALDPQSRGYEISEWLGQIEQNQLQGMQLAPGVAQFAALPITAGADVTNVVNTFRTPLANVTAMQQNLLGLAGQQGTVSPDVTLQVGADMITQNMQQQMAQATALLNYKSDRYAAQMTLAAAEAGASATEQSGLYQGIGAAVSGFSDRRLKQDIEQIGVWPNGLNVYKFRYKWGGPTQVGFMADEVRRVHPEAVFRVGGYDAVDYGKAVL